MKYLFYDNIVKGAGLGHTLACYNYGVQLALKNNLKIITRQLEPGHGFNSMKYTTIEQELGLPVVSSQQLEELIHTDQVEIIPFTSHHPVCNNFTSTKEIFNRWYDTNDSKLVRHKPQSDITTIAISIRRGDLACASNKHSMRSRLLPLEFYLEELSNLITTNDIHDYHLTVSCDTRGGNDLIDQHNNILDVEHVFKDHLKYFSFLPSDSNGRKTFIFFHHAVVADYFIGSNSGFSKIINDVYRKPDLH